MKKVKLFFATLIQNIFNFFDNRYVIAVIFFALASLLLLPKSYKSFYDLNIGDVAPKTIRSDVSVLVEDKDATKNKIKEIKNNTPPIFDYNPDYVDIVIANIETAMNSINKNNPTESMTNFFKILKTKPNSSIYKRLLRYDKQDIIQYAKIALSSVKDYYVISSIKLLYKFNTPRIIIRNIKNPKHEIALNKNDVIDLSRAKIIAYNALKDAVSDNVLRSTVWDFISELMGPNITFNNLATQKAIDEEIKKIGHVFFKISKGEIILRSGDIITKTDYLKLNALNSTKQKQNLVLKFLSKIISFIIISIAMYKSYTIMKKKSNNLAMKKNTMIAISATIIILQMLILRVFSYISVLMNYSSPDVSKMAIIFGTPFAFASILSAVIVDFEIAFFVSVLISITSWLIVDSSMSVYVIIYVLIGSVIGAFFTLTEKTRTGLIKAGLAVSLSNTIMIFVFYMFSGTELSQSVVLFDLFFGVLGGIMSYIAVSGLLPVFEYVFNITTDIKLLELGNLNNTLLKELAIKAPGTYHHSIVVSSLSEAAASAIGANATIAKVGSYYHDIGKIQKPMYFIENQSDGINPHDRLKPSISALIILNHVKYGVEIAKKHRLGSYITDIIKQHHGTTLIKYFYNKAKENGQNPKEEDFRYKGPKPQTKEAGIIMIADEVEAASKTLENPTVSHLNDFVREITNSIFLDEQLDECDLTLKDLNLIMDSFVKVLVGIFHHRIEYPEEEKLTPQ